MRKGRATGEYNTPKLLWQENRPDPMLTLFVHEEVALLHDRHLKPYHQMRLRSLPYYL